MTRRDEFTAAVHQRPVIAAARTMDDVREAAASRVAAVFLLGGSILTLPDMMAALRGANKFAFIHLDLCDGLISTKAQLLRKAEEQGMLTIHRLFLVDSSSLRGGMRHIAANPPDLIEVLPGLVPKAISQLRDTLNLPVIAGGMVTEERDVEQALAAGALAVSSSERGLWRMGV